MRPESLFSDTQPKPSTSPKAKASLILPLISLALLVIVFWRERGVELDSLIRSLGFATVCLLGCGAAIVLGHIAYSQISENPGTLKGRGLAIAGLIVGYPTFLLLGFGFAFALHDVLQFRAKQNESYAMLFVRDMTKAAQFTQANPPDKEMETAFNLSPGKHCNLGDLEKLRVGGFTLNEQGDGHGYHFTVSCGVTGDIGERFRVVATPLVPGDTGRRVFCADSVWGSYDVRASEIGSDQCDLKSERIRF